MPEPLAYLNGQMLPASQARLPIYDAGIVLGATVTEMTRTFRHEPFRLDDHLARLFHGLGHLSLDIGMSPARVGELSREVLAHNLAAVDSADDLGLIQFVTAGEYPTYAAMAGEQSRPGPTVCIHTFPLRWELWAKGLTQGLRLVTPTVRHVPPECYEPSVKYRSRLHYYLADQEARRVDPEAKALLLDLDGHVTETSGANFLIVDAGTIVSPTLRNILPGISRATVVELAGELGIPFEERDLSLEAALAADEAFVTSTPYCLMGVTRINGHAIGDGRPGSVLRKLQAAWSERVGVDIAAQVVEGSIRRRRDDAVR